MKAQIKSSRLATELIGLASDMKRVGLVDGAAYDKIIRRHHGPDEAGAIAPVTQDDVKAMRAKAQMSQAVFARHLNLSADYISQLERGEKRPAGAALALLDVIRRKGIDAII